MQIPDPGLRAALAGRYELEEEIGRGGMAVVVPPAEKKELALGAADSVKRLRARSLEREIDWFAESAQSVYEIRNFIEFKTTWHPIGA